MISRKSLLIVTVLSIFVSSTSMAVMCARLKHVSGGEDHTLVLGQNGQAFACGERSRTVEGTLQLFPPSATAATTIPRNLFLSKMFPISHPYFLFP